MKKRIEELTSLLFKTKQLVRAQLPAQADAERWLRLETLSFIAHHKNATMRDIAEYLRIKPPSATSLITTIEREGFARRSRGDGDRRAVHVALTVAGEHKLRSYRAASIRALERVFSKLDSDEIDALISVLRRLHRAHE